MRVVGFEFPPRVDELEKAGLSALPSEIVKTPRIANAEAISSARSSGPSSGCTGSWS